MSLENEISIARKEIVSDGYDMSIGEIINLYRDKEIIINPEFQRLFRWDSTRKTRFIESILLGLPLPPIFVYQGKDGIWELIDGLQRISTILEFVGLLEDDEGKARSAVPLEGTRFLPSLTDKRWESTADENDDGIGTAQQLQIKRARMRIEILKQESDPQAKFELFQRLNTGGQNLSEQEVRNCIGVMLDKSFQDWLVDCANNTDFLGIIDQTESAIERQAHVELALRLVSFRHIQYKPGLDVHEYLDDALLQLANSKDFDRVSEKSVLSRTFQVIRFAMGETAFKRWNGTTFSGKFLMSVFEVVALGISKNIDFIEPLEPDQRSEFIRKRCIELWNDQTFNKYSGAGIRGTSRLANLLPMAADFFKS